MVLCCCGGFGPLGQDCQSQQDQQRSGSSETVEHTHHARSIGGVPSLRLRWSAMADSHFLRRLELPVSADEALAWHERPGAFERRAPPWEPVDVIERAGSIRPEDRTVARLWMAGLPIHWVAEHYGYESGRQFCDRELAGPFAVWEHVHRFVPHGERCVLED